jgi:hypothetical protein
MLTPDECDGRCVTSTDVGLPEYEPALVHRDPECTLHGIDAVMDDWAMSGQEQCDLPRWVADAFRVSYDEACNLMDSDLSNRRGL